MHSIANSALSRKEVMEVCVNIDETTDENTCLTLQTIQLKQYHGRRTVPGILTNMLNNTCLQYYWMFVNL